MRSIVPVLSVFASIVVACGGGGGSGSGASTGTADDEATQAAVDLALQAMIQSHTRDVCNRPSTCGALGAYDPDLLPRAPTEARDLAWGLDHLGDREPNEAFAAILGAEDRSPAFPKLRTLASAPGSRRLVALGVLGLALDEGALDVFTKALGDDDSKVRAAGAWALGRLGPRAESSLGALRARAATDADFATRCRAADAAATIARERIEPAWVLGADDLYVIGTPPSDGACGDVGRALCTTDAVPFGDECLVGLHGTGTAGLVATFPKDALETAPHGTSVDGAPADGLELVMVGAAVALLSGHDGRGAVHRIVAGTGGHLKAELLAELASVPKWYRVDGTTLVVQTADQRVTRLKVTPR